MTLNGQVEVTGTSSSFGRLVYLQSGLSGDSGFHVTGGASTITCENTETVAGANFFFDSTTAGNRRITGAANQTYTFAPTTVVHGGGVTLFDPLAGGSGESLINQGLIRADVAGQTISVIPNTLTNQGTLEAMNGATLGIGTGSQGTQWTNSGTLRVGTGSTLQLGGNFTSWQYLLFRTVMAGPCNSSALLTTRATPLPLTAPAVMRGVACPSRAARSWAGAAAVTRGQRRFPLPGAGTLNGVSLSGDISRVGRSPSLTAHRFTD